MKWIWLSVIPLSWLAGCQPQAPDPDYSPPHSPQAALDTFELGPGFKIEVFAAEPLIRDPVAMEVDEDGRIYVVEMGGYPLNTEPIGRIRLLLDQDGDGLPDESRVFADGLVLPTGVMRWKNGILVTAAPDLLYLEDSDGDGRADVRKTVLTGFAFSNPQHTVNLPVYGLDNWIYLAHEGAFGAVVFQEKFGDRGGRIHYPDRPDLPALEESRFSVRLRPDTGGLENLSAPTQYGHSFDEWGRYFTLNNAVHARHPEGSLTDQTLERAAMTAADPDSVPELRTESIQLLGLSRNTEYLPLYSELLTPSTPEAIRVAASASGRRESRGTRPGNRANSPGSHSLA